MRRLSTSTRNTTSEPPNSYTTVTVTLTLTLLRNTVLPYRTAVTEFTVYVAHARARRERRALATAPGSGARAVRTASDTRTGFELAGSVCSRFRACHRQVFYISYYLFAGSCSRLVALSRLFGPARRVAPVPHGRCGRCIPIWIRVAGESHCLRRPMPPHSCAARARCRAGRALLKRLRQARAQTVSRALLATGT